MTANATATAAAPTRPCCGTCPADRLIADWAAAVAPIGDVAAGPVDLGAITRTGQALLAYATTLETTT